MIINHNIPAIDTYRNLTTNQVGANNALEKLSSGLRINKAADDAAGLAISEKMRAQVRGLDQAGRNAQDGISLIQTAEGGLNETHSILQRMRELSVQASNGTNTVQDRSNIQLEVAALTSEVGRIATATNFNTKNLLDGSLSGAAKSMTLQIGADSGQTVSFNISNMDATGLGINGITVSGTDDATSIANASSAITTINTAINTVSVQRANLGAMQNRLEHTVSNLATSSENLTAAESRIRDADMAKEMMSFSKYNILTQAGTAMLAQANQAPQQVLSLLR